MRNVARTVAEGCALKRLSLSRIFSRSAARHPRELICDSSEFVHHAPHAHCQDDASRASRHGCSTATARASRRGFLAFRTDLQRPAGGTCRVHRFGGRQPSPCVRVRDLDWRHRCRCSSSAADPARSCTLAAIRKRHEFGRRHGHAPTDARRPRTRGPSPADRGNPPSRQSL